MRRLVQQRLARVQPGVPWLFHCNGTPIRQIRARWRTLCVQVGLATWDEDAKEMIPRFRPHDLRRSAVTNLLDYMSPKQAMQITGHLTLSTFTRYQQVPEDQLRARLRSIPEPSWTTEAASRAA